MRTLTGETPFKLAYGSEVVIPAEVHMANHRVMTYQEKDNEEQLCLSLNLIDEVRMDAEHRTTRYKNLMARQHDAMVKPKCKRPYKVINCKRQDPTTWKPWTGGNWSTLGMLNT